MFTTYSASAGSGKTTHLVADYLALCFRNDSRHLGNTVPNTGSFRKILAITFTNAAAAEMKDRIVQTLQDFAFVPYNSLSSRAKAIYNMIIEQLFGVDEATPQMEDFMRRESLDLLRNILYDYARFSLSTIDKFFQQVIRSSALSLNLNLNYSVQIDLNEFFIQAVDQLLNELSAGSELAKKIIDLLNDSMEDSGNLNVDRELRQVLDILYENAEKNYDYLLALNQLTPEQYRQIINQWRKERKETPDIIKNAIKEIAAIGNSHIQNLNGISFQKPTLAKWFDKVMDDPITNYEQSIDVFLNDKGSFFRKTKFTTSEQALIDQEIPGIIDCFNQIRDIQDQYRPRYLDAKILLKNADKLMLLFDLQQKMNEIKKQHNFFILSESNTFIYDQIKGKNSPEIFDRITFSHFFIDEFQDTSLMQWRDLKPLITNNSLATGGQVTLFGDVKQAIYRFRNGDADLFYNLIDYNRLQNDPDLKLVGPDNYHNEALGNNFRSSTPVILFNNEFFKQYSETSGFGNYYEDVEQKVPKTKPGLVEVMLSGSATSDDNGTRTCQHIDEELEQYLAIDPDVTGEDAEVFRAVRDALERGYDYGDIAILYAGNDKCTRMANLLLNYGWPVVTEKSLVLNASPAINLIIQTIKHLVDPSDRVAQTSILHYLAQMNGKTEMLQEKLLQIASTSFHTLMIDIHGEDLPTDWLSLPLFLLVKKIIVFYKLEQNQDPFIVDFENIVLNYLQNRNGEPAQFLLWWQQLLDTDSMFTLTLPNDLNAIKVNTIHKSKGLEYPVVIIPFSSTSSTLRPVWTQTVNGEVAYIPLSKTDCIGSSFEPLYQDEALSKEMDTLNLLYVAHTRAGDILYIITSPQKNGKGYGAALQRLIFDNEQHTTPDDPLHFVQDEGDPCLHYAGNPSHTKDSPSKTASSPITPPITASPFSIQDIAAIVDTEETETQQRLTGTFVHDFLAKLTRFPQDTAEMESLLAEVDEERRPRLREAFLNIMGNQELAACFAPETHCLNETTILAPDGTEHRPDRIALLPDRVMVIDYKTGQAHPEYQKQIDTYCDLLRNMGYKNVEGRLLYI